MTFHVRLISLPSQTSGLVEALTSEAGVSNLVVLPGTAQRLGGDAVQFDVAPRSANAVFRQLKAFRDDRSGAVAIDYVDAALGEETAPASKHFLVQRDIAPVWEVVEAKIRSDAVYAPSFYVLLAIAGLIGAVGILSNSQILIVGAMVVGPEYNAIMGVALGIDKGTRQPVLRGILALLAGFSAAMVVTLLFALAIRWSGHTPKLYSAGVRPVSDLIDNPNLFSIVVAVLAGIVGVVSLTEARASALIGSVTTIPAAADISLPRVCKLGPGSGGGAFQLLLNVTVLIAMACSSCASSGSSGAPANGQSHPGTRREAVSHPPSGRGVDAGPVRGHVDHGPLVVGGGGENLVGAAAQDGVNVVGIFPLGVGVVDNQLQGPVRAGGGPLEHGEVAVGIPGGENRSLPDMPVDRARFCGPPSIT
jgi:uncharacterized hydrophobic protein (TIGR00271 family)